MTMNQCRHYGGLEPLLKKKDLLVSIGDAMNHVSFEDFYYHYYSQLKSAEMAKHSNRMSSYISEYGSIQDA